MILYSIGEVETRLTLYGTVFTMIRWKDGEVERFILENDEVQLNIKELQNVGTTDRP